MGDDGERGPMKEYRWVEFLVIDGGEELGNGGGEVFFFLVF